MSCWEDLWASCATLLKDLTKEEQAKAAYHVLNDACISTFLPSSSPEPPSPAPAGRPASPKKQTSKAATQNKQTPKQSTLPNKPKTPKSVPEVKKEVAATQGANRRQLVLKKSVKSKARSASSSLTSYKGMKLRVKQEPRDPLAVNHNSQARAKNVPQKSILKKRVDPKRGNMNIKRERLDEAVQQNQRRNGHSRINIKKEFGNNGRRMIKKKFRCYNDVQRSELNRTFDISAYPSIQDRRRLEGELGLTKAQVQTWFVNKRLTKGIKKASGGRDMPGTLSVEQLDQLTTSFTVNSFPSKQDRQLLSTLVGMTEAKVNAWFTSQRTVEGVRKPVKIQLVDLEKAVRMGKKQTQQLEEALSLGAGGVEKVKQVGKELGLRAKQISSWLKKRNVG